MSLLVALAPDGWAQVPLGPEFAVNTYTTFDQRDPSIAMDSAGNFVVVWQSDVQDGNAQGIFARKFTAAGTPLGVSEFRVNAYTTGGQLFPAVASDPSGNFVVVWTSPQDGAGNGIVGRRFDATGTPGPEFAVNAYTTGSQSQPAIAMDATGKFVVAWRSAFQDGSLYGVFARRFDAAGVPLGGEFAVNAYTTGNQLKPSVGIGPGGNFVLAWDSLGQDGSNYGVFARRFDAAGTPQGGEFQVNATTSSYQYGSSVSMASDGGFLIAWTSGGQDGDAGGVFARKYDASGNPGIGIFQVNDYTTGFQGHPRVAADVDGTFMVVWESAQDPGGGVFARTVDDNGRPQGAEFQVNTYTTNTQSYPVVARQPSGRFVFGWRSSGQDGDSFGVFGRRFAKDVIFQDGFESGTLSRWSSASTDSGDLLPSVLAAMKSTSVGLSGTVDDTASLFVEDDTPIDENRYRARFYLATNGFDPGESNGAHRTRTFLVFEEAPTRRLAAVVLKRQAGAYSIEGRCRLDTGAQADTGFFPISDGPHVIEIDWKRSSSAVANDGTFELWIDGVSQSQLTGLANSVSAVDFARLGALSVKPGAQGTLFWDEFESRRITFIGS